MSESNKSTFENRMDALISAIKDYIKILSNYYENHENVTMDIMDKKAYYGFVGAKDMTIRDLEKKRARFPLMLENILNAIPPPKKPTFCQKFTSFFTKPKIKPEEPELQNLKTNLTNITTNYGDSTNLWLTLVYTLTKVKFKHLKPAINLVNILKDYLDLELNFVSLLRSFNKIATEALKKVAECETNYEDAKRKATPIINIKKDELNILKTEQAYCQFPLNVLREIQKNQIPALKEIKKICERYQKAADVLTMICVLKDKLDKIPSYNAEAYSLENSKSELLNQLKKSRPKYSEKLLTNVLDMAQKYCKPYLEKNDYLIYKGFENDLIEYMENYSDKLVAIEQPDKITYKLVAIKHMPDEITYHKELDEKIRQTLKKIYQNLNNIHVRKKLKSWEDLFNVRDFYKLTKMMGVHHSSYQQLVKKYENVDALTLDKKVAEKTTEVKNHYNKESKLVENRIKELDNQISEISSQLRAARQKYENARSTAIEIESRVESIVTVIKQLLCKSTRMFQ